MIQGVPAAVGNVAGHLRMLRLSTGSVTQSVRSSGSVGPGLDVRIGSRAIVSVGRGVRIGRRATLRVDGELTIGEDTFINNDTHIVAKERVTIGSRVRMGERVSIHDENHVFEPICDRETSWDLYSTAGVTIEDFAWIGCGSVILSGASVGAYSVVAAGSIVRGEVPPRSLVAGNPARVIRQLSDEFLR